MKNLTEEIEAYNGLEHLSPVEAQRMATALHISMTSLSFTRLARGMIEVYDGELLVPEVKTEKETQT